MKALVVRQPYASAIALGEKSIEYRTWKTDHRGGVLIVSAAKPLIRFPEDDEDLPGVTLPAGFAFCAVMLEDCRPFTEADLDAAQFDEMPSKPGYAWVLTKPQEIRPFPVKGKQRLFDVHGPFLPLPAEIEHHLLIDYSSL